MAGNASGPDSPGDARAGPFRGHPRHDARVPCRLCGGARTVFGHSSENSQSTCVDVQRMGDRARSRIPKVTTMNVTIVAATGGIGRLLLADALDARHNVTVIVRNPKMLSTTVRTFVIDLTNPDSKTLQSAIQGTDAVLSGLGARSAADAGVAARGTRAILQAMSAVGANRIVVVSAAPIGTVPSPGRPNPPKHDPGDGFFMRHLLAPITKAALRQHYADLARMEDVLRESGTEWTIVRPPKLTNGQKRCRYRIAFGQNLPRGLSISRADVADFMLHAIGDPTTIRQVVGIAN